MAEIPQLLTQVGAKASVSGLIDIPGPGLVGSLNVTTGRKGEFFSRKLLRLQPNINVAVYFARL